VGVCVWLIFAIIKAEFRPGIIVRHPALGFQVLPERVDTVSTPDLLFIASAEAEDVDIFRQLTITLTALLVVLV
jgi:hypothetical protein